MDKRKAVFQSVLRELTVKHRERFESEFALAILGKHSRPESVNFVSAKILHIIDENRETVLKRIADEPKFAADLFDTTGNMFGRMEAPEALTPDTMLATLEAALVSDQTPLIQLMHIHSAFMYRVASHLEEFKAKRETQAMKDLAAAVFPASVFSDRSRTRRASADRTRRLGIARGPLMLKALHEEHMAAADLFMPDQSSPFFIEATKTLAMPFVAGHSGHTGSFVFNALFIAEMPKNLLNDYAMAAFGYLAAGGNHSFHEVMRAARLAGAEYKDGDYASAVPESMSTVFRDMRSEHPAVDREFAR